MKLVIACVQTCQQDKENSGKLTEFSEIKINHEGVDSIVAYLLNIASSFREWR